MNELEKKKETPEQWAYRQWSNVRFNCVESREQVEQLRNGHTVWVAYYAEAWPEKKTVVAELLETRCRNTLPCSDRWCAENWHWH